MEKPKIRFKGYQEDWEQRKLGDLVDRVTRKNQDLVSELPLTISAQYGLIDQNEFFDKRVASKDVSGYYLIENGEFAYNKSTSTDAPWGAIKRLGRYENGVLSTLYIVFGIKENYPVDSDFLVSYYSTNLWHKGIHEIAAEGARNHGLLNIAPADFFETKLMIPQDIEEQEKIGKYFEELERLITLHQRKCEEMKTLKKYMLQKMFPQNGQLVPQIRFSGFTEDWEQRKLSNCAGFRRGSFPQPYGNKDWYDGEGAMPFVQVADVSDDMKLVDDTKQKISKLAQPMSVCAEEGSVLVTLQGSIGRVAITQYKAFVDRTVLIFDKYNADIDKTFWAYIIKEKFIEEARKAPGGTIKTITKEVLSDFDLMLPSYDEQKMLGKLLHSLDDLITLHQQKCDELRNIKKFMLQNMFI